jgi:hypothetical protein
MIRCDRVYAAICMAGLFGFVTGCSTGDSSAGNGGGGNAGGSGNSAGSAAGGMLADGKMCINDGIDNPDCPAVPPVNGDCASKGECCHRSSNSAKEKLLGKDDPLVLEYRINYSFTINHPMTIGSNLLATGTAQVYETEQQSYLIRIIAPRKDGKEINGAGKFTFNTGRYNCDGTYSYYGDTTAPAVAGVSRDPARWAPHEAAAMIDVGKTGIDRVKIPFSTNPNRTIHYTPNLDLNTYALDWELLDESFRLLDFDPSGAGRDCVGARDGSTWTASGKFESFTPLAGNNQQKISAVMQSYCSLVAFNILANDDKSLDCETEPRCVPGSVDCRWVKLPDALCPTTNEERALFGCHLGAEGNVNQEMGYPADLHCTPTAPATAQDPDQGVSTVGQCCDPLGKSSALPACNGYRLINEFVAAAAEITDDPKNEVQAKCF